MLKLVTGMQARPGVTIHPVNQNLGERSDLRAYLDEKLSEKVPLDHCVSSFQKVFHPSCAKYGRSLIRSEQLRPGFTLLEILVVVVIIGITINFALLAFGDFGSKRRIQLAAEQFVNYTKLAQQQAILEANTLGINFNKHGYQVIRFIPQKRWDAMPRKSFFHPQHFPNHAIINLDKQGNTVGNPDIIIHPSGDMTPFTLYLGTTRQTNVVTVVGSHDGSILLQSP